jgi:hypothetical protein
MDKDEWITMKSIAIIYLCTGKYRLFWEAFYKSAQSYFVPDMNKEYFVFTDQLQKIPKTDKVHLYYQPKIGWPYDVLIKWDCICRIQEQLAQFDYIALCNANMQFLKPMELTNFNKDFLLTSYITEKEKFTFETNPISQAYIKDVSRIEKYIQSGFIIGETNAFLRACRTMRDWTSLDLQNGHIPLWHDESMFNAYIYNNNITNIEFWHRGEVFPEEWVTGAEMPIVKAVFRDKNKYGGHELLRETKLRFRRRKWSN